MSTWARIKRYKVSYLFIAPFGILFFTFTVIPVVVAIVLSFTNFNMLQTPSFVGWSNYVRLFLEDEVFLIAIKNTFIFAAITGPLSYFACFLVAWLINELKPWLRAILTLLFYAPAEDIMERPIISGLLSLAVTPMALSMPTSCTGESLINPFSG